MTSDRDREDRPGRQLGRLHFLRATLVGGVLFLLPLGVVLVVFDRLVALVAPVAQTLHDTLFPQARTDAGALTVSLALLALIAFSAGLVARSGWGRAVFQKLEDRLLLRVPVYALLRDTLQSIAGSADQIAQSRNGGVVLVRLDDQILIGIVKERLSNGTSVVFLPGAPSALSGTIALVDDDRLAPTEMTVADVFARMRALGTGLAPRGDIR